MFSLFLILDVIGNIFIYTNITLIYVILYSYKKYNNIYFIIILGLLYDFINGSIYNTLIYFLTYLIIKKYKSLNTYILGIICIINNIFINYLFSLIFNSTKLDIFYLIKVVIINYLLYIILSHKKIKRLI